MKTESKVVLYKGGGYDGCIWEMNWFMFDSQGNWHNLYHSGYSGIKDDQEHKARELYKEWETEVPSEEYDFTYPGVMRVIDLDSDESILSFSKVYETVVTLAVLRTVNDKLVEQGENAKMYFKCDHCEKHIYPLSEVEDGHVEGLSGNGGVGFRGDELYCDECHSSLSCDYCGEFDSGTHKQYGYCSYHFEVALKRWLESLGSDGIQHLYVTNLNEVDIEDYVEWGFCFGDWINNDPSEGEDILWIMKTDELDGMGLHEARWYITEAPTEKQALDILSEWTEGKHFQAEIWKAREYLNEYSEELDARVRQ